jgi:hypothetical protein
MRAVLTSCLLAAVLGAGCDHSATVLVVAARPSRDPDNRVAVEVEVEAVEQAGGSVGRYCVSVHWFSPGFNPTTEVQRFYQGELDWIEACASDLEDGDRRTVRLVSNRTDLAKDLPARVQVKSAGGFQTNEGVVAP